VDRTGSGSCPISRFHIPGVVLSEFCNQASSSFTNLAFGPVPSMDLTDILVW
jgi:hypothetical protein